MNHTESFLKIAEAARRCVQETTIDYVHERITQQKSFGDLHLVDVREDNEWEAGHLPTAVHLGRGVIERDIEQHFPDCDTELILYCGGGYRSALTAESLQKMGYTNVISMDGGFHGWTEAGLPVMTDTVTKITEP